jgi:hypothetical protein
MQKSIIVPSWVTPGATYYIGSIVNYDGTLVEDANYNNATYLNYNLKIKTNC